jgi:murein DD-endopeptidase MepM/ murein hydrolase activator NlpD
MEIHSKRLRPQRRRKKMSLFWLIVLLSSIYIFYNLYLKLERKREKNNLGNQSEVVAQTIQNPWQKEDIYTISEGDIPAEIFAQYGHLDSNDTLNLLESAKGVYDFSKLKIGQHIHFYFNEEEKVKQLEYDRNTETKIVAKRNGNIFEVREEYIPYKVTQKTLDAKIDEFFYKDALDVGLLEPTILEIADVFSFDIDFTTEIRKGDEFKIIYEERTLDGKRGPDGRILAAKFVNAGQEYRAYYFKTDNEESHYDGEGRELRRQFLRAPLSYRYISSGYTGARYHPITKTVSAHYQIDYAAPIGTPVVATAQGTVTRAGWEGGWGNMVRMKHNNGYATHYGHLSAFAKGIRSGVSVAQGQIVGYVGSTGWSTGPHLDYGMRLNGSPVNPLSLKLPKGNPLTGEKLKAFQKEKEKYDAFLE